MSHYTPTPQGSERSGTDPPPHIHRTPLLQAAHNFAHAHHFLAPPRSASFSEGLSYGYGVQLSAGPSLVSPGPSATLSSFRPLTDTSQATSQLNRPKFDGEVSSRSADARPASHTAGASSSSAREERSWRPITSLLKWSKPL